MATNKRDIAVLVEKAGLKVEGDETEAELVEALAYLVVSRGIPAVQARV